MVRANDAMFVAAKKTAFRARATALPGSQQLFIQGGCKGTISARGEIIELWEPMNPAVTTDDRLVATLNTPATTTPAQSALRITEIMYDPPAGGSFAAGADEFLELKNKGATPLNLSGATFTDGITFTFGATTLNPGDYIVLVKKPAAFTERYGSTACRPRHHRRNRHHNPSLGRSYPHLYPAAQLRPRQLERLELHRRFLERFRYGRFRRQSPRSLSRQVQVARPPAIG